MESNDAVETLDYNPTYSENNQQDSSVKLAERKKITIKGGKIYAFFKRIFDIVCSLLAIIVLAIPMLIVGIIVKCTSKGPMIYVSKRVGKNGKVFNFYKFRSMVDHAEDKLPELLKENEVDGGVTFKMKNDPRITKVGHFLRKTSLDELPQLINILKGDMSVIGPRPCTPREKELYGPRENLRLMAPQGLTGEWQAKGRSDTTFDQMIDMDIEYLKKRSLWYDFKLIFVTIGSLFKGRGAE